MTRKEHNHLESYRCIAAQGTLWCVRYRDTVMIVAAEHADAAAQIAESIRPSATIEQIKRATLIATDQRDMLAAEMYDEMHGGNEAVADLLISKLTVGESQL